MKQLTQLLGLEQPLLIPIKQLFLLNQDFFLIFIPTRTQLQLKQGLLFRLIQPEAASIPQLRFCQLRLLLIAFFHFVNYQQLFLLLEFLPFFQLVFRQVFQQVLRQVFEQVLEFQLEWRVWFPFKLLLPFWVARKLLLEVHQVSWLPQLFSILLFEVPFASCDSRCFARCCH